MSDNHSVIVQIALSKIKGTKPDGWDINARTLFDVKAKEAYSDVTNDELEAAWRDALAVMRDSYKVEWDEYCRSKKDISGVTALDWEKVKLVKGHADGDMFELTFDIDGVSAVIECSDIQLLDPSYIQRKMVMYTRKDVKCPYLGKKNLEIWRRNVVLPWLKSEVFTFAERETLAIQMTALIREFATRSIGGEDPSAWLQLKRPVIEGESIYIPFAGLQEFVGKRAGIEAFKRTIKNALKRMGFIDIQKGSKRMRFHAIKLRDLYEEKTGAGEAGSGKIDEDSTDGKSNPSKRSTGLLDELREEERERFTLEGGDGTSVAETQGGDADM